MPATAEKSPLKLRKPGKGAREKIALEKIPATGAQARVRMETRVVDEYVGYIESGSAVLPPIEVYGPDATDGLYYVGDGFHRLVAHRQVGTGEIECIVRPGGAREALLHALAANESHGLRRSNADRRRAVEMAVADPELGRMSNRGIAEWCHVHHQMVGNIRAEMERRGDIAPADTTVGTDGREVSREADPVIREMREREQLEQRWLKANGDWIAGFGKVDFAHGAVAEQARLDPSRLLIWPNDPRPLPEDLLPGTDHASVASWRQMLAGRGCPLLVAIDEDSGTVPTAHVDRETAMDALETLEPKIEIFRRKPCSPRHAEKVAAKADERDTERERRAWLQRFVRTAAPAHAEACGIPRGQLTEVEHPDPYFWLTLCSFAISQAHVSGLLWLCQEYHAEIEATVGDRLAQANYSEADRLILVARSLGEADRYALTLGALLAKDLRAEGFDSPLVAVAARDFDVPFSAE